MTECVHILCVHCISLFNRLTYFKRIFNSDSQNSDIFLGEDIAMYIFGGNFWKIAKLDMKYLIFCHYWQGKKKEGKLFNVYVYRWLDWNFQGEKG